MVICFWILERNVGDLGTAEIIHVNTIENER